MLYLIINLESKLERLDYIQYWAASAVSDLKSMESNYASANYDWALFIGHLSLEKMLKALWVKNNENINPPRVHNLRKLADEAQFKVSKEDAEWLLEITDFNLEARYPDYKFDFHKKCTKEFAEKYINKIKEFHVCIAKLI